MSNYYINSILKDIKQYNGRTLPSNINIVKKTLNYNSNESNLDSGFTGLIDNNPVVEPAPSDTNNASNSYNAKKGGIYFISNQVSYPTSKSGHHKKVNQALQNTGRQLLDNYCARTDCNDLADPPPILQNPQLPSKPFNFKDAIIAGDTFGCLPITLINLINAQLGSSVSIDVDCFIKQNENGPLPKYLLDKVETFKKMLDEWRGPPPNKTVLTESEKEELINRYLKQLRLQWKIIDSAVNGLSIQVPIICADPACPQRSTMGAEDSCLTNTCSIVVELQAVYADDFSNGRPSGKEILDLLCAGKPIPAVVDLETLRKLDWTKIGSAPPYTLPDIPPLGEKPKLEHSVTIIGFECDKDNIYFICQDSYPSPDGRIGFVRKFRIKVTKKSFLDLKQQLNWIGTQTVVDGNITKRVIGITVASTTPADLSSKCTDCAYDTCDSPSAGCTGSCLFTWNIVSSSWYLTTNSCGSDTSSGLPRLCICSEPAEFGTYDGQSVITYCKPPPSP